MKTPPTKALILAAGIGNRLGDTANNQPKCLLSFNGISLIERHLQALAANGIENVVIVVGYQAEALSNIISAYKTPLNVSFVENPDFTEGSVVSLWTLRNHLQSGEDVLLMDADVLYSHDMIKRLVTTEHKNTFLLDRDFEAGDEPVKLCVNDKGLMVEFRKLVDRDLTYDFAGESVGFFRFSASMSDKLARQCENYINGGQREEHYEEAIRDLLLAEPKAFGYEDVTGIAWVEIDFPEDIQRAQTEILPQL